MEKNQKKTSQNDHNPDQLSLGRVLLLIFAPTTLLTLSYLGLGHIPQIQNAMPSFLLFFLLAFLIFFPFELLVVLSASKRKFGRYSLKSAFLRHEKIPWWQIALFGTLSWGFAGLMTVTVLPLETRLFASIAERLTNLLPAYFDWTNIQYLERYSSGVLTLTAIVFFVLNVFIGPIIEELFFRGYLSAKISRFGNYTPVIMTVLFSLYHFWLPFDNLFRITAFLPGFYVTWKKKNIYIAIVLHCLSNLFSTIGFVTIISALI